MYASLVGQHHQKNVAMIVQLTYITTQVRQKWKDKAF